MDDTTIVGTTRKGTTSNTNLDKSHAVGLCDNCEWTLQALLALDEVLPVIRSGPLPEEKRPYLYNVV